MILTNTCRPAVRRALQSHPPILLVGQAAAPSAAGALDAAASSVFTAADQLTRREGIDVRHLLPADPAVLALQHRTQGQVSRYTEPTGRPFTLRWSVWTPPGSALTVLLLTGPGMKIDADTLGQPAVERVARVVQQTGPSVVYARSLTRLGRGFPAGLVRVLQGIAALREDGPFLGDETIPLAEPDPGWTIAAAIRGMAEDQRRFSQPRLADGRFAGRPSAAGGTR